MERLTMKKLLVIVFMSICVFIFANNLNEDINVILLRKGKDYTYLYKTKEHVLSLYYTNSVLDGSIVYSKNAENSVDDKEQKILLKSDKELTQVNGAINSNNSNYLVYCNETDRKLVLQKFDDEGNPLWGVNGKIYNNITNIYYVVADNMGGLFLLKIHFSSLSEADNELEIFHVNEDGNIDWNKSKKILSIAYPFYFSYMPISDLSGNLKILVYKADGPHLVSVNINGDFVSDLLLHENANSQVYMLSETETIIVTQGTDNKPYFNCFNQEGTFMWKKEAGNIPLHFIQLNDGGFLTFYPISSTNFLMNRYSHQAELVMGGIYVPINEIYSSGKKIVRTFQEDNDNFYFIATENGIYDIEFALFKLNLNNYVCEKTSTYPFFDSEIRTKDKSFLFDQNKLYFSRAEFDTPNFQYYISTIDYQDAHLISKYYLFEPGLDLSSIQNCVPSLYYDKRVINVGRVFLEQDDRSVPANREFADLGNLYDFNLLSNNSCIVRKTENLGKTLYIYDQYQSLCDSLPVWGDTDNAFSSHIDYYYDNDTNWIFYKTGSNYFINKIVDNHFVWGTTEKSMGNYIFRGYNDHLILVNDSKEIVQLTEEGSVIDNYALPSNIWNVHKYFKYNENLLLFYTVSENNRYNLYVQIFNKDSGLPVYQGNGINMTIEEDSKPLFSDILFKDNVIYLPLRKGNDLILRQYQITDQNLEMIREYKLYNGPYYLDSLSKLELVDIIEYGTYHFFIIQCNDYFYYRYLDKDDKLDTSYNGYALFDFIKARYVKSNIQTENSLELFFYEDNIAFSKTIYLDKLLNYPDYNKPLLSCQSNYPNPFTAGTKISFYLNGQESVKIEIFNIKGQKIKTIDGGHFNKGLNTILWDGRDSDNKIIASGIFLYKIISGGHHISGKMLYLK